MFNKRSLNVEKSIHVSFDETNTHISKIIEDADISGFENPSRIDSTKRNSDPTSSEHTCNEQKSESIEKTETPTTYHPELPKS